MKENELPVAEFAERRTKFLKASSERSVSIISSRSIKIYCDNFFEGFGMQQL